MTTEDAFLEPESPEPRADALIEQLESLYEIELGDTGPAVVFDPAPDTR